MNLEYRILENRSATSKLRTHPAEGVVFVIARVAREGFVYELVCKAGHRSCRSSARQSQRVDLTSDTWCAKTCKEGTVEMPG